MSVPNFQQILLPLLRLTGDGEVHTLGGAIQALTSQMGLTEAEEKELLPSGRQTRFANRVAWARAHMKAAGLLETVERGKFRITREGISVLATTPTEITSKYLEQFPGYLEFRTRKPSDEASPTVLDGEQTPEESLEANYLSLRDSLAGELLGRVKAGTPRFFEQLVVDLLVAMGYGGSRQDAGEAVGQSGDGGIDGVIREDKLGLDTIYLQAKRWEASVGRPTVQAFAGSLEGVRARKGVLITTSSFTADARDYVSKIEKKIVLIDGRHLAELMIDHGVGVSPLATYTIHRVDEDFFEGELSGAPDPISLAEVAS